MVRVQIPKEVISDMKRENQFLSKEIWESLEIFVDQSPSRNLDSEVSA